MFPFSWKAPRVLKEGTVLASVLRAATLKSPTSVDQSPGSHLRRAPYLSSQSPFLDLGDVGVCGRQRVEIHLVELVVELLPKLPGQVVVAERAEQIHGERMKNGGVTTLGRCSPCYYMAINFLDSRHQESPRRTEKVPVFTAVEGLVSPCMFEADVSTHPSMRGVSAISFSALSMLAS